MAIRIEITNLQKRMALRIPTLRRLIREILKAEGVAAAWLSLVFVTDRKIHSLNKRFLGHDYPTDVLAFDLSDFKRGSLTAEIIISTDAALRQAKEFQSTPYRELVLYAVHGILHLGGYDDHRPKDLGRMRAKEEKIMRSLRRDLP